MALSFDPRLNSSDSRNKRERRQKADNGLDLSSAQKRDSKSSSERKGAKKAAPIKGKRKSINGSSKKSESSRKSSRSSKKQLKEQENARKAARAERQAARDAQAGLEAQPEERQGRRVGDIRARERAERTRKRYRNYILRIAIVILAVLAVIFGSIFVYRSDLLAIKHINVVGVEHLSDAEITRLAAVPDDSTLLRLDKEGICERLETHAWVQSAEVTRKFPDSLEITIVERTPAAVVRIDKKTIWVVSNDGAWLSAATEKDWKTYNRIKGVSASLASPTPGSDCNDEGIKNAIKVFKGVSPDLLKRIKYIEAESAAKTTLILRNGITVAFGEATDIKLKEADIWKLARKYKDTISYINVRVPSRPSYRTLQSGN